MAQEEKNQQAQTALTPVSRGIGRRIYELRQAKSLSQAHIASRLDLSRAAITQWENGITYPSLETIESLAVLLNTTPWYLAFGHGAEVNSVSVMQIPWIEFDEAGNESETSMITIPRPVISAWRVNDLRRLVAISINDNSVEGLPTDLAIVDRSNTQAGFNVKVAVMLGYQVQIVNLSHTPGTDEYRISMSGDTFTMAQEHVQILGRVVGKVSRA